MHSTPSIHTSSSPFDQIRRVENEHEYWSARDLQGLLGYTAWHNFEDAIERAKLACQNSGHKTEEHFNGVVKTSPMPNGGFKTIQDYHLSRYACYLVAVNGDPRKKEIAAAQTYFAMKPREAKMSQAQKIDQPQTRTPLQGLRDLLPVPYIEALKQVLRAAEHYKRTVESVLTPQSQREKQPPAPTLLLEEPNPEHIQRENLRHLERVETLTVNTLRTSCMKHYDTAALQAQLEVLLKHGKIS
uniref:Bro-N domain-containing protein n=1 Tax=Thermosporothrix sp. COM3 TaxID=2490863 RepID=A0A455SP06_9CHLR|nr:hypothetical protein KTC_48490 [Thermosporothrix sp. COM3]BBH90163.1 hypothetical protein KTC_49140 [Thermosporothrix sp. COM3]BBH90228.1 hypothetical protein KTC_49790 [Thermosporothrix sp. COM3]